MMNDEIRVAPSVLSADFRRLADELADVSTADLLHYDVMDGHFVPNLSFGIDLLRTVKSATELPVDVHLMISNPDEMVERYLDAGADVVSFHYAAPRRPSPSTRRRPCVCSNPSSASSTWSSS